MTRRGRGEERKKRKRDIRIIIKKKNVANEKQIKCPSRRRRKSSRKRIAADGRNGRRERTPRGDKSRKPDELSNSRANVGGGWETRGKSPTPLRDDRTGARTTGPRLVPAYDVSQCRTTAPRR
jgi:hypothetical protein|uniref:Uncharacterized protein n=1 Tax=Sipha flava TaxID=143950 RepID=A0A2S2PZY5_9HEMI